MAHIMSEALSTSNSCLNNEDRQEIERRVKELRLALGRSSDRRILYLAIGLRKRILDYSLDPLNVEAWRMLEHINEKYSSVDAAKIIFDAIEVDDESSYRRLGADPAPGGDESHNTKVQHNRPRLKWPGSDV